MGAKTWRSSSEEGELPGGQTADGSAPRLRSGSGVKAATNGRVLVVDDEVAVGRTIQRLLGDRHEVVVLTSGGQAIELLESGANFDVILCDMSMPGVTGIDVYSRAAACRPELVERFVFMTGGSFSSRTREFLESASNEQIDKPFDLDVLRAVVGDRVAQTR